MYPRYDPRATTNPHRNSPGSAEPGLPFKRDDYRPRLIVHTTLPVRTFLVWPGRTFTVFLMVAIVITSNPPELFDRQAQHALLRADPREVRLPRGLPQERGNSLTTVAPM